LLGIYSAAGEEDRAYGMADRLAKDPDPEIRASMGPFFFDRGAPVTAAQLDRSPDRCYLNADSPRMEAFLYYRSKQGDGTFGDIEETALPIPSFTGRPRKSGQEHSPQIFRQHRASTPRRPVYRFLTGPRKSRT
jgi:hypothetical protein